MDVIPIFKIGIWNAWIFMSVFIFQMLVIMFAGDRVRTRSHIPVEARHNKLEKNIGLIANLVWFIILVYSIFSTFKLGSIWFVIGLLIYIIGLTILSIATHNFICTAPNQLITKGVYKLLRHPMYLATFFICLGSGFSSGSWLFIFLSVIMFICFHKEALVEENYCQNKYGKAYEEYRNRVPRWIKMKFGT